MKSLITWSLSRMLTERTVNPSSRWFS